MQRVASDIRFRLCKIKGGDFNCVDHEAEVLLGNRPTWETVLHLGSKIERIAWLLKECAVAEKIHVIFPPVCTCQRRDADGDEMRTAVNTTPLERKLRNGASVESDKKTEME